MEPLLMLVGVVILFALVYPRAKRHARWNQARALKREAEADIYQAINRERATRAAAAHILRRAGEDR